MRGVLLRFSALNSVIVHKELNANVGILLIIDDGRSLERERTMLRSTTCATDKRLLETHTHRNTPAYVPQ